MRGMIEANHTFPDRCKVTADFLHYTGDCVPTPTIPRIAGLAHALDDHVIERAPTVRVVPLLLRVAGETEFGTLSNRFWHSLLNMIHTLARKRACTHTFLFH